MLTLANHSVEKDLSYEPQFFRIYNQNDRDALEALLNAKPHIKIHDELDSQLDELIKSKHPKKKPDPDQLKALKLLHLGDLNMEDYGVWVYYPWSERLVHLLDEEEFVNMRTNRNVYKITPQERDILGKQIVGVVGLSVGQSVSVTMAMERGFGEIRLADFDLLELSNLNRIRTGVQSLGLPKVIIVAREIKEIDPFLKVTCFNDGLTEENMDRFFTEGGKLNVIVDECDGLDIKILLRHKAKSLGIPVVMDASDRGTVDVERFDLEPDRPILHGLIEHLDHTQVKYLKTNEEKVPFLLAMIGVETLSNRLKASMIEVGQSITTWPQLASAVTLGGALCADVCRRIILDQYHESGRYWIDIEELIGDKTPKTDNDYNVVDLTADELTVEEMESAATAITLSKEESLTILDQKQITDIVTAAGFAPSGGNTQPWKFLYREGMLYLFHDEKEAASWMNYNNNASYIALGAAIENLKIKASSLGVKAHASLFPVSENKRLIASIYFQPAQPEETYFPELVETLNVRLTNRKKGNSEKIDDQVLNKLVETVRYTEHADLLILEDQQDIEKIAGIVSAVERIRFMFPQGHHDFYSKELKWTTEKDGPVEEGMDIKTLELAESDKVGLRVAASPDVIKLLNKWGGGAAFEKISKGPIASSSAIGLITLPEYSSHNYISGGQALQRVWMTANLHGLSFQPLTAPFFMFAILHGTNGDGMPEKMKAELTQLEKQINTIFPSLSTNKGVFMFRLSYADEATIRTARRPVEKILHFS